MALLSEPSSNQLRLLLLGEDDRKSDSGQCAIAAGLLRELSKSTGTNDQEGAHAPEFTIVNAAGDEDVISDLLIGTAGADAVVLVVGASRGWLQWAMRDGGRVQEQLLLMGTLGFKSLVVCVDQVGMESDSCAEQLFKEVQTSRELKEMLESAGFQPSSIPCVPTADLCAETATPLTWYHGQSLLNAIIGARVKNDLPVRPLRVPLHEVYKVKGTEVVAVGRIEMGMLKNDAQLAISPGDVAVSARRTEKDAMDRGQPALKQSQEAGPGEWVRFVGLSIDDAVVDPSAPTVFDPSRPLRFAVGDVLCDLTRGAAKSCSTFIAEFVVLREPPKGIICNGYQPTLDVHTSHVPCLISELRWRRPAQGQRRVEQSPSELKLGDIAEAWLRPLEPVCLEVFSFCPPLGRFSLCDQEVTIAAGVIKDVRRTAQQIACFDD